MLLVALIGIGVVVSWSIFEIAAKPPGFINDRLTVFDALAQTVDDEGIDVIGTGKYAGGSLGRFLIILLGAAYLAEKYLLQAWRVRWPVPLLPLAAIAVLGWIIYDGERQNREFVAAREWRAVAPQVPWIDGRGGVRSARCGLAAATARGTDAVSRQLSARGAVVDGRGVDQHERRRRRMGSGRRSATALERPVEQGVGADAR